MFLFSDRDKRRAERRLREKAPSDFLFSSDVFCGSILIKNSAYLKINGLVITEVRSHLVYSRCLSVCFYKDLGLLEREKHKCHLRLLDHS